MIIAASILTLLAVISAIYTGIFWTLGKMMGDYVVHNRVVASSDPTGFQKWCREDPRMVAFWLTALTGLLLVLALMAIC